MENPYASGWEYLDHRLEKEYTLFNLAIDQVKNLRNGKVMDMLVVESKDAANAIVKTKEGKIVLIEQYRFGTKEWSLELPGGLIEKGEDAILGCKREVLEETGYTASNWSYLGKVPANPVFMNSYIHHFLAEEASFVKEPTFDDGEQIVVHKLSRDDFVDAIKSKRILHPHSLSAIFYLMNDFTLKV